MTPMRRRALFRLSPWRRDVASVVKVLTMCVTNISSVTLGNLQVTITIIVSVELLLGSEETDDDQRRPQTIPDLI